MSGAETARLFVAVPIGAPLREALGAAVGRLRATAPELDAAWRWTEPEGWHLTLAFLGATPLGEIGAIQEDMADAAAGHTPFEVATGGLGAFPASGPARVAWYRVEDAERRLASLARDVRRALDVQAGDAFRAHLTLARSRARFGTPLEAAWQALRLPSGVLSVTRIVLYRSHLGRGPANYEALAEVPLRVPAAILVPAQP